MKVRLKVLCPLCGLSHFSGDIDNPTAQENPDLHELEIVMVTVSSGGRGKIKNFITPLFAMPQSSNVKNIEREILGLTLTKAQNLVNTLESRLEEL